MQNYIGGTKSALEAVVPSKSRSSYNFYRSISPVIRPLITYFAALVGTAEGTSLFVGTITPLDNAYAPISSNPNEFSTEVKQVLVPQPPSGPGVIPEAFDLDFISAKKPLYTAKTFHVLINQPVILNNLLQCQRNTYYFNQTFTNGVLRSGNATLMPPTAGNAPKELGGVYTSLGGYSASGENVGYNAEDCKAAATALKNDPDANK